MSDTEEGIKEKENEGAINRTKTGLEENFKKGAFLIAMLLLLMATFQLYFSIENILRIWFEYQYVPIFKAAYNLVVLLISVYIIRLYIIKR